MSKFPTHETFKENWQVRQQKPLGNSVTIPGQSMSIQQIIDKYSKGEYIPPKPAYYGDDIDERFLYSSKYDFTDVQSMYEREAYSLSPNTSFDQQDSQVLSNSKPEEQSPSSGE